MKRELHEIRDKFRNYLTEKGIDNSGHWLRVINLGLAQALYAIGEMHENQDVFSVTDLDRVNEWRDKIRSNPSWIELDRQSKGELSKALRLYAHFIENLDRLSQSTKGLKAAKPMAVETAIAEPEPGIRISKRDETIYIEPTVKEGDSTEAVTTRYERSGFAKRLCIEAYGNTYRCEVCGTKLSDKYGTRDNKEDYIEVHHIVEHAERSKQEGSHAVNYRTEMIPLCPNCHRMIHFLKDHTISPEELREIIHENERKN